MKSEADRTIREKWMTVLLDAHADIDGYENLVDAIIAALPGMIPELVWEDKHTGFLSSSAATSNGKYHVAFDGEVYAWYASLEIGEHDCPIMIEPLDVDTFEAAKAAANAHHRAAVCKVIGLEP